MGVCVKCVSPQKKIFFIPERKKKKMRERKAVEKKVRSNIKGRHLPPEKFTTE